MKKTLAILLAMLMIIGIFLISCKGEDDHTNNPVDNPTEEQTPNDSNDQNPGDKKPGDNQGGGLQVGEDDDDGKWGDFIPYN